jgi:hypothetical protein
VLHQIKLLEDRASDLYDEAWMGGSCRLSVPDGSHRPIEAMAPFLFLVAHRSQGPEGSRQIMWSRTR